jgi:lipopolysaccharide transport system ATP-binding protein
MIDAVRKVWSRTLGKLVARAPRRVEAAVPPGPPTVIHITHPRAGSQWIYQILQECVGPRVVTPDENRAYFLERPLEAGKVYPAVYVTHEEFHSVRRPANARHFVIIRDPRDTLVSLYFSLKISHPDHIPVIAAWRSRLQKMSAEEGFLRLMEDLLPEQVSIPRSWCAAGERVLHYEDLLTDDLSILSRVLLDECQLGVSRAELERAVLNRRFEQLTRGRPRGQEDQKAHERKGVAGDWRNHFTPLVKREFEDRYGDLLRLTGYERTSNW